MGPRVHMCVHTRVPAAAAGVRAWWDGEAGAARPGAPRPACLVQVALVAFAFFNLIKIPLEGFGESRHREPVLEMVRVPAVLGPLRGQPWLNLGAGWE